MKKSSKFKIIVILFLTSLVLSGCAKNDTVKINNHESLLIAHRGLSGLEVENTDAAFIAAGERSYYGIEADVRRTSDGRFIICHDADLERVGGEKIDGCWLLQAITSNVEILCGGWNYVFRRLLDQ